MNSSHCSLVLFFIYLVMVHAETDESESTQVSGGRTLSLYSLEGKIVPPPDVEVTPQWLAATRVIVNYGEFLGFMR